MSLLLPSFAKINWLLRVLGRREDGFHEICTVLQSVDLHDEILLEVLPPGELQLEVEGREVAAGVQNLVWRAARLLQEATGCSQGARLRLRKRIPVGAGLGGGSSNAAVTLMGLNRLWGCGLSSLSLRELAARLGSDVPFFLLGGTVLARGRGEILEPLPDVTRGSLLVVYPGFSSSTAVAYQDFSRHRSDSAKALTTVAIDSTIQHFRRGRWGLLDWGSGLVNDLEEVVMARYPALAAVKEALHSAGCRVALMSGSGSSFWGWCPAGRENELFEKVSQVCPGEVFMCRPLAAPRYRQQLNLEPPE